LIRDGVETQLRSKVGNLRLIRGDVIRFATSGDNFDLTEYLIGQLLQSESHRMATLDAYYPSAKPDDWTLQVAG
jgi:L-2-hydroxyglutarate oxidase LhgO